MAFSPDLHIWYALKSRLVDIAALVSLPIEWPNEALTAAPAAGYLRVRHIPNAPSRFLQGSEAPHERLGIVQVMVYSKRGQAAADGVDNTARAMRAASQIAAYFPPDQRMVFESTVVRVRQAPRVGEVVNPTGSAYAECAVEIQYRCFA